MKIRKIGAIIKRMSLWWIVSTIQDWIWRDQTSKIHFWTQNPNKHLALVSQAKRTFYILTIRTIIECERIKARQETPQTGEERKAQTTPPRNVDQRNLRTPKTFQLTNFISSSFLQVRLKLQYVFKMWRHIIVDHPLRDHPLRVDLQVWLRLASPLTHRWDDLSRLHEPLHSPFWNVFRVNRSKLERVGASGVASQGGQDPEMAARD